MRSYGLESRTNDAIDLPTSIYQKTERLYSRLQEGEEGDRAVKELDGIGLCRSLRRVKMLIGDTAVGKEIIWLAIARAFLKSGNNPEKDLNRKTMSDLNSVIESITPSAAEIYKSRLFGMSSESFRVEELIDKLSPN